ncbi:hypothetical protein H696_04277 [Fonticula alba]|uniref:Uncharacterized protein n=1 Tax=Fonticula alba TaxID=691883 RepID=A0A058Z3I8_FONAL|nr:hypothetical protein H696_04277 [Fonticula alba]KCV68859.1 hypothetical protein H696_04277 [Fonticula alba]|eukprot:XP_009496430.1 hypothetical protein H696_04277 [Fonticula alba]
MFGNSMKVLFALLASCLLFAAPILAESKFPTGRRHHFSEDRLWGFDGHEISAWIATFNLTAAATQAVETLVGPGGLPSIATWADNIKGDSKYKWASELHYVTTLDNPPTSCSFQMSRDCPRKNCVVGAVYNYTEQLTEDYNGSTKTRQEALKFLTHFVQDLHNPMHVYGKDRGGNDFPVYWYSTKTNMHSIWDSRILVRHMDDIGGDAESYLSLALHRIETEWSHEIANWLYCPRRDGSGVPLLVPTACPEFWASQANSAHCDLPDVWGGVKPNDKLGDDYYFDNRDTVMRGIAMAGLRLAAILNEIFV